MEKLTHWRKHTNDVGDPEAYGRVDVDRLLRRLFDSVHIAGAGKTNAEQKLAIQELWDASGGNPAAIAWGINEVLQKNEPGKGINYIKSILPGYSNGGKNKADSSAQEVKDGGIKTGPSPSPRKSPGKSNGSPSKEATSPSIPPPAPPPEAPTPKPVLAYSKKELDPIDNSIRWKPELSKLKYAPMLISPHKEALKKRAISPEFAMAAGARTMTDDEAQSLSFDASISVDQRRKGLNGISFAYCDPATREERSYRLKPDARFDIQGSTAKYINRKGDPLRIYFPHSTTAEMLQDTSFSMVITEGEFKTLSIAENLPKAAPGKRYAVIGLSGVNGGWQRGKYQTYHPDGSREEKSHGNPHLIEDFDLIKLTNRTVYVVFDSDVGRKKHAELFKKSKYQGAIGAEHILVTLLRARGAEVRIVQLPDEHEDEKTGADDFIASHGPGEFLKVMHNNWVTHRDVEAILHVKPSTELIFKTAQDLVDSAPAAPPFIVQGLLPHGGTAIIAGAPKTGKSYILLNLAWAVANGDKFLGQFQCMKGNVLYIQTEIPEWMMAQRLQGFGDIPQNLYICTPDKFCINFYEEDNFRKVPTGNNERIGALVAKMKEMSISLLMLDPLNHFHSMDENKRQQMTHVYEVIRMINRAAGCSTVIAHHNRKTGGRQGGYQGAEDMLGSQSHFAEPDCVLSLYKEVRKDSTHRTKMLFEVRHCEQPVPQELVRTDGENSLLWFAEPWIDKDTITHDHNKAILDVLKNGSMSAKDLHEKCHLARASFFRAIKQMEKDKVVEKVSRGRASVYCLAGREKPPEDVDV